MANRPRRPRFGLVFEDEDEDEKNCLSQQDTNVRHTKRTLPALEFGANFNALRACESGLALRFPPQAKTRTGSLMSPLLSGCI